MDGNVVSRVVKAAVACLAAVGVSVSPENSEAIITGFLATYGVMAGIQAKIGS